MEGTPETLRDRLADKIAQLLDEADALLSDEPRPGERIDLIQKRSIQAQWLMQQAHLLIMRGMAKAIDGELNTDG